MYHRLITLRQSCAVILYGIMWPSVLDYCAALRDCSWSDLSKGAVPHHVFFKEQSKPQQQQHRHHHHRGFVLCGVLLTGHVWRPRTAQLSHAREWP